MTFKSAYLKLTLFYVLIVMIISLTFSFVIYNISTNEIDRGLGRQTRALRQLPNPNNNDDNLPPFFQDLDRIRSEELQSSTTHLRLNLIYFNLLILALSAIASYFLARRTLRPIEEMMTSQNRFIADASHELKTPLTAMRSEIEVTLRDKKLKLIEGKKLLKSNLEEIARLEVLSNALLKLAKYQEDLKLDFRDLNLSDVIVSSYEKVESNAREKLIEFKNELKKIIIKGDEQSLTELFVILLDNAIKYSPRKSKIKIVMNKDKKMAIVSIKDGGVGIKASDMPHIFDRFYRADHSRSKEQSDGYGLGLSIAKRIVELHGGKIFAKSKPGDGSEFIVKLPLLRKL